MPSPGEYLAEVTEGITRVEDLPKPKVIRRSRNYKRCPCPRCGKGAYRLRCVDRLLHDVGDLVSGRPHDIHLTYSQHHCSHCGQYFNADMADWALPGSHYTHRVVPSLSGWSWRTDYRTGLPRGTSGATTGCSFPSPRSRIGSRPVGKKAEGRMASDYLTWALANFSGYIAADELYNGPFCVLSLVDNRRFKRLVYEVLDHDPTQEDLRRFFKGFNASLTVNRPF